MENVFEKIDTRILRIHLRVSPNQVSLFNKGDSWTPTKAERRQLPKNLVRNLDSEKNPLSLKGRGSQCKCRDCKYGIFNPYRSPLFRSLQKAILRGH